MSVTVDFHVLGPGQTSNFTCAEFNANCSTSTSNFTCAESNANCSTSFALDSAHVKFDVLTRALDNGMNY